jgi:hypothetical protein
MSKEPTTLQQAIIHFADPDNCIKFLVARRWPDGVVLCPRCGSDRVAYVPTRRVWQCKTRHEKCQFSIKVGTIFEDSAISLDKWLVAMWYVANCKNGVSSWEVHRDLGVTQKTAWFMLHRIRLALGEVPEGKMGGNGPVEVDETFIGPNPQKMHADKRQARYKALSARPKTPVMGMLDRESRQVRANVVPNVRRETLQNAILEQIEKGSTVYTDSAVGYDNLVLLCYKKSRRQQGHLGRERARWVAIWRCTVAITKDNPLNDADRFTLAVSQIVGKRLTYAELTGKESN